MNLSWLKTTRGRIIGGALAAAVVGAVTFGTIGLANAGTAAGPTRFGSQVGQDAQGNTHYCVKNGTMIPNTTLQDAGSGNRGLYCATIKAGGAGTPGPKGDPGPSGVVGVASHNLVTTDTDVATGGSFNANATEIGTVDLKAGTYLLNFSAKAKPNTACTCEVFPQFFIYNQAKNPDFAGNLFNVGTGALEPNGTNHDSYFSGSSLVTLANDATLHVYAFGYDSDQSGSKFDLEVATLQAVQVTPAG